jgi:hypothetical protein
MITSTEVAKAGASLVPCAECGHIHCVVSPETGLALGWIECPIDDCDCEGQT